MWEPRHFTALWTFTACYRNSFVFYLFNCRRFYSITIIIVVVIIIVVIIITAAASVIIIIVDDDVISFAREGYGAVRHPTLLHTA
jgi:hypothetical protein